MRVPVTILFVLSAFISVSAQQHRNINELLGYPAETKLLIIHADDIGLSNSTNRAVIDAFESGSVTSGSMMVPCPWFQDFAAYAKSHPGLDVGIHFTLNSEWKYYKFGGIASACDIPGLLDKQGHFWPTVQMVAISARPEQVEKELRAQIERAIALGVKPTHLDSHMGSIYVNPALFRTFVNVAKEFSLPVSLPFNLLEPVAPFLKSEITPEMVGVDNFMMLEDKAIGGDWMKMYSEMIANLVPGLNEIVVHLAYDNEEMKAICTDQEAYGSAWRQNDLDVLLSDEFKKILKENNAKLITWREIQEKVYPQ